MLGHPCQRQRQHIGQVVPGIGYQSHRAIKESGSRLDCDESNIERNADGKGAPEIGGDMMMPMTLWHTVMGVAVMRVVCVRVTHRVTDRRKHRARHA